MKQATWIVVALVSSLAGLAHAAEPGQAPPANSPAAAAPKTVAVNPDAIVPKREVKFVVSLEEVPVPFKPDVPGLLDQRYIVSFGVAIKFPDWQSDPSRLQLPSDAFPKEIGEILQRGGQPSWAFEQERPTGFSALIDRIPQQRLPPAGILADMRQEDRFPLGYVVRSVWFGEARVGPHVTLLAKDPRQAEALGRAALTLVDYGWLVPAYPRYAHAAGYLERWLLENREKLEKATRELDGIQKQLDEMKDYAADQPASLRARNPRETSILRAPLSGGDSANVRSQLQLVAVDMAGARARIDACAKILQRKDLAPTRVDHVETLKMAAEIELIGLAAKEQALKALLQKTSEYNSLARQSLRLRSELARTQQSISAAESRLAALRTTLEPKTFFGQVVSTEKGKEVPGTIFIRKIKWTEPKRSDPPPAQR